MGHQTVSFFILFDTFYPKIHLFSLFQRKKNLKRIHNIWRKKNFLKGRGMIFLENIHPYDNLDDCGEIKIEMEELIEPRNLLMLGLKEEEEREYRIPGHNF